MGARAPQRPFGGVAEPSTRRRARAPAPLGAASGAAARSLRTLSDDEEITAFRRFIRDELRGGAAPEPKADVEVAIVGVGPAGLSAAITAQRLGLSYAAIEQDRVLATIEAYPANKSVFFKPETMETRGGVRPAGAGAQREAILEEWTRALAEAGVRVNESESCESVKRAEDGDYFVVQTERGAGRSRQ